MKKTFLLCFCCVTILTTDLSTQSSVILEDAITENTSDQGKFQMYLDTMRKYLYRDPYVVHQYMEKCENLIQQGAALSKADLFAYHIERIYYVLNTEDALSGFQIIKKHEQLLNPDEIPQDLKNTFLYLKGFTYMRLGELEYAQSAFYEMIDKGKAQKDTSHIINGLYSLGQLLSDEEDYDSAIKYFKELLSLEESSIRASTFALANYELSEAYYGFGKIESALEVIESLLLFLEKEEMFFLKADYLLLKGEIALKQKKYQLARELYTEASQLAEKNHDSSNILKSAIFKAKVLSNQGNYASALQIYESIFDSGDTTDLTQTIELYTAAHAICKKNSNYVKAYDYLLRSNVLQKKLIAEKKRQQTDYLKIKYESEQKEKENEILAAQIAQEKSQDRLLYALIALLGIGLFAFWGAFDRKRKFNRKLKRKVKSRTTELEHANKQLIDTSRELDEFNRILSHDLKEPLRSIASFSTLLKKEDIQNLKIKEYLTFIEHSGKQLYQILDDVSTFQNIGNQNIQDRENLNVSDLVEEIISMYLRAHPKKTVLYYHSNLPIINANRFALQMIFKKLIENAFKFNESTKPEIHIRYYRKKGFHRFEFKDNGIGIAPQFHEKIFGMFNRLNSRSSYQGSGLGLSMAKKMALRLEGDICVLKSAENKGSIFQFSIPITAKTIEVKAPLLESFSN